MQRTSEIFSTPEEKFCVPSGHVISSMNRVLAKALHDEVTREVTITEELDHFYEVLSAVNQ